LGTARFVSLGSYHHCGEAASEKCLSAAMFVSAQGR
jgi:hypothetical protein